MRLLGDVFDRHGPATSSDEEGETLGVERMVRQPVQPLLLHLAAALALDAPNLQLQVDPYVAARQIAHSAHPLIVPTSVDTPTGTASRFFPRLCRRITRAFGVTEDASDCRARTETGEAVCIPQTMVSLHSESIPDFRLPE